MSAYQPKTGAKCGCRRGVQRDNCPRCEGTGMVIDFKAIREKASQPAAPAGGAQFTPGPWRVDGEGMQVYKDKQPIAVIRTVFDENGGRVTREANATLIAAAPAMYEVLKHLVKVEELRLQATTENDYVDLALADKHLQELAKTALAQAEGRQG